MSTLLVTGANGKLGRHVVNLLLAKGGHTVIATSRDPSKLADLAAKGAQTRRVDFDDPASLRDAFKGVDRVLIISTDALGSGQRLAQHKNAVQAAKEAGAAIIYTSMPKPDVSKVTFAGDHLGTEQAIRASGATYTILRNAWYQENLLAALPHALETGQWFSASGVGLISHIAHADCAEAAAAALTQAPENKTYTLTGPELLTTKEIAALASAATGKPLTVIDVTDEQLAGGLNAAGLPEAIIPMLVSFDANTREGGFDVLTDNVEVLTGHKPHSLADFFKAAL